MTNRSSLNHFKTHRSLFMRILIACFFFPCIHFDVSAQLKRFSFTQPKMGSPFTIVFYSDDSVQATTLAKKSFNLVDSFVSIFSDYIDTSELSKLSASAGLNMPVAVSPAMLDILILSKTAFKKSGGAFDITIGPVVKLWRQARKTKQFPSPEMVKRARSLTGFNKLVIDSINKKAILLQSGMQLDLGGIAQGYIAQKIINFLTEQHINHALVNASGDIVTTGAPPGTKGWTIGVNVPESKEELLSQKLLIQHKTVSTSGDAYQFMEHGGKRYSHIIDPRTGYGVTSLRNVTVIAADGTTADWLATACSILPIKKAKQLATQMGGEVLVAEIKNERLVFNITKGFSSFWKPPGR
ncbi:MAG: FAD:protein FMN transferase [Ferruginibacter sp.]